LRSFSEASKAPNVFGSSPEVVYRHIPLIADFDETPEAERPADLEGFYRFVLDRFQPHIRAVLEMLARPATPPVLIHCTAGKDRTGVVIALLLSLVDVPNETIVEDYLLTDRYIDPLRVELRAEARQAGFDMERYEQWLACQAEAMTGTLDYLQARYGGVESFCRAIGLADYQIRELKRILVEE
jgi:protein-tyrosine phosphatase